MKKTNIKNKVLKTWLLSLTLTFALMLSACQSKETTAENNDAATTQEAAAETTVVTEVTSETETTEVETTETAATEETATDETATANQETQDEISFTLTIVYEDASSENITITTTETTLRAALEKQGLIAGTDSEYGLYVQTVNNVTADESLQQWWCLTKGGEVWNNGVDTTEISDGDQYELTLTTGW